MLPLDRELSFGRKEFDSDSESEKELPSIAHEEEVLEINEN